MMMTERSADDVRSDVSERSTPRGASPPIAPASALHGSPPTSPGELIALERISGWPRMIGIFAVVLASIAILANLYGIVAPFLFQPGMVRGLSRPGLTDVIERQAAFNQVFSAFKLATAILLLIVSILMLHRRASTRKLVNIYAVLQVVIAGGYALGTAMFQIESLHAISATAPGAGAPGGTPPTTALASMSGLVGFISFVVTFAMSGGFAVFLLVWFNRAKIRRETGAWGLTGTR